MNKFEYLVFCFEEEKSTSCSRFKEEENVLNGLGAQGYELISVMPDRVSGWMKAYLKRKLNATEG